MLAAAVGRVRKLRVEKVDHQRSKKESCVVIPTAASVSRIILSLEMDLNYPITLATIAFSMLKITRGHKIDLRFFQKLSPCPVLTRIARLAESGKFGYRSPDDNSLAFYSLKAASGYVSDRSQVQRRVAN